MRKAVLSIVLVAAVLAGGVAAYNYFSLKRPVAQRLAEDERNEVLNMDVRYSRYVNPNVLVVSLEDSGTAAPIDVLRGLLQTAEALQDRSFSRVELHHGYEHRFTMEGDYFQELGEEYDYQNPIYTLRTLPEELERPDGGQAFYNFQTGLAGLSEEMETFKEFAQQWQRD